MITCYYHNDIDGISAGWIVHKMHPKYVMDSPEKYFSVSYTDIDSEKNNFNKHLTTDNVVIVDFSFKITDYKKFVDICNSSHSVTWIDHHASSIDFVNKYKKELQNIRNLTYFVSNNGCGALLTYAYFYAINNNYSKIQNIRDIYSSGKKNIEYDIAFNNIGKACITFSRSDKLWVEESIEIPLWLKYIDDYDRWQKKYQPTDYYIIGLECNDISLTIKNIRTGVIEFNYEWEKITSSDEYTKECINRGKSVRDYLHSKYLKEKSIMFEWKYDNYTFICKNSLGNSWNFLDILDNNSRYSGAILFSYDGKNKKWKYSVYSSSNSTFNCKTFCEYFGGGGHKNASGFTLDKFILKSNINKVFNEYKYIFIPQSTNIDSSWIQELKSSMKKFINKNKNYEDKIKIYEETSMNKDKDLKEDVQNNALNLIVVTPESNLSYSLAVALKYASNPNYKMAFIAYDKNNSFNQNDINTIKYTINTIKSLNKGITGIYYNIDTMLGDLVVELLNYKRINKFSED